MSDTIPIKIPWNSIVVESFGFIWGFFLGGLTGMFGNWLYDKYTSWSRRHPALLINTTPHKTFFKGTASQGNKQQVLETLCKAIPDPKNKVIVIAIDPKNSAKQASISNNL